jgi:VWFA-related protein
MTRPTLLACALATLLVVPVASQPGGPASPDFQEEVTVEEVLLDVLVTDRQGNVIVGLGKDDFVVEEEGRPVSLVSATFYSNRRLVGADPLPSAAVREELADRWFVLFLHDQRDQLPALTGQQMQATRAMREWARQHVGERDWVAVVGYDVDLRLYADFTNDPAVLERAVESALIRRHRGGNWPSRRPAEDAPSLLRGLPTGGPTAGRSVHHALRQIAEALGPLQGRKNLLLFSIGFGEVDEADTWSPDPRYYRPMMRALNDNNVAVYAVDLVPVAAGGAAQGRALNDSLSRLADDTGGRYYLNFNSFADPLAAVAEENTGYYLLSYQSAHPARESGFRDVTVRTRHPGFQVRARKGYSYGPETGGAEAGSE